MKVRQEEETPYGFLRRKLVIEGWGEGFADNMARLVAERGLVEPLMDMALAPRTYSLNKAEAERIAFRSAYVVERLYFTSPELVAPLHGRFLEAFATAYNGSVMRHWGKMAVHLLRNGVCLPSAVQAERMAQACAEWVVDPKVKVAVKVHAMELLFLLADNTDWVQETLPDLVSAFTQGDTPAVWAVMRRWRREGRWC